MALQKQDKSQAWRKLGRGGNTRSPCHNVFKILKLHHTFGAPNALRWKRLKRRPGLCQEDTWVGRSLRISAAFSFFGYAWKITGPVWDQERWGMCLLITYLCWDSSIGNSSFIGLPSTRQIYNGHGFSEARTAQTDFWAGQPMGLDSPGRHRQFPWSEEL